MGDQKDFFISYTQADKDFAEWIAWTLEENAYTTLIQAWDIVTGTNFVLAMDRASRECRQTILVLSENYLRSDFSRSEWAVGFAKDPRGETRKLLPIRVRECHPDGLLTDLVYTDLVGLSPADAKAALLRALEPRLKPSKAPSFPQNIAAPLSSQATPYPASYPKPAPVRPPAPAPTSKRYMVGLKVDFKLNTPDGLRRVIFGLQKTTGNDVITWIIDFSLFERIDKTLAFSDPLVELHVQVDTALNKQAETAANQGLTPDQAAHALGSAADDAKAAAVGTIAEGQAHQSIQATLEKD